MRFSNLHIVAIILMLIISINSVTFSQNFLKQTDSISNKLLINIRFIVAILLLYQLWVQNQMGLT